MRDEPRDRRILEAGKAASASWNLLFVHTDGEGHPERARLERALPAMTLLKSQVCDATQSPVAVVPVRETEAWALADPDALRAAFGTRLSDQHLGFPLPTGDPESLPDPKQVLDGAYQAAVGTRRRCAKAAVQLEAIGERVSLDKLRRLPAFARLVDELTATLTEMGYLGG